MKGTPTDISAGANSLFVAVEDLNADGFLDIAVTNFSSDNISVLLGNGTGSFGAATYFDVGDSPRWAPLPFLLLLRI